MKKLLLFSVVLGGIINIALTFATAKLEWSSTDAVCPGIPYSIKADAAGGFPLKSTVSVSALGTCGEVTSRLTVDGLIKLLLTRSSIVNLCIWLLVSLPFCYFIWKLRAQRR